MPLPPVETRTTTIASGASMSLAMVLGQNANAQAALVNLCMSAGWDAAALTIQGIPQGLIGTLNPGVDNTVAAQNAWPWVDLYDPFGNPVSLSMAASRGIVCAPQDFLGWWALRFRSGVIGTPVNQTALRTITCAVRGFG